MRAIRAKHAMFQDQEEANVLRGHFPNLRPDLTAAPSIRVERERLVMVRCHMLSSFMTRAGCSPPRSRWRENGRIVRQAAPDSTHSRRSVVLRKRFQKPATLAILRKAGRDTE